ncbi:hypothetical protein ACFL1H_03100 [Nanoarchaeota archaeon]
MKEIIEMKKKFDPDLGYEFALFQRGEEKAIVHSWSIEMLAYNMLQMNIPEVYNQDNNGESWTGFTESNIDLLKLELMTWKAFNLDLNLPKIHYEIN